MILTRITGTIFLVLCASVVRGQMLTTAATGQNKVFTINPEKGIQNSLRTAHVASKLTSRTPSSSLLDANSIATLFRNSKDNPHKPSISITPRPTSASSLLDANSIATLFLGKPKTEATNSQYNIQSNPAVSRSVQIFPTSPPPHFKPEPTPPATLIPPNNVNLSNYKHIVKVFPTSKTITKWKIVKEEDTEEGILPSTSPHPVILPSVNVPATSSPQYPPTATRRRKLWPRRRKQFKNLFRSHKKVKEGKSRSDNVYRFHDPSSALLKPHSDPDPDPFYINNATPVRHLPPLRHGTNPPLPKIPPTSAHHIKDTDRRDNHILSESRLYEYEGPASYLTNQATPSKYMSHISRDHKPTFQVSSIQNIPAHTIAYYQMPMPSLHVPQNIHASGNEQISEAGKHQYISEPQLHNQSVHGEPLHQHSPHPENILNPYKQKLNPAVKQIPDPHYRNYIPDKRQRSQHYVESIQHKHNNPLSYNTHPHDNAQHQTYLTNPKPPLLYPQQTAPSSLLDHHIHQSAPQLQYNPHLLTSQSHLHYITSPTIVTHNPNSLSQLYSAQYLSNPNLDDHTSLHQHSHLTDHIHVHNSVSPVSHTHLTDHAHLIDNDGASHLHSRRPILKAVRNYIPYPFFKGSDIPLIRGSDIPLIRGSDIPLIRGSDIHALIPTPFGHAATLGQRHPSHFFSVIGKALDNTWGARKAVKTSLATVISSKLRLGGAIVNSGTELVSSVVDAAAHM